MNDHNKDTAPASAALIAAAPELLEAAKLALDVLATDVPKEADIGNALICLELAIANAEGRE